MLLGFLWDKPDIFDTFSEKFIPQYCDHLLAKKDILGLNSFLGTVIHRLFVDLTGQVQDWRVVNIQERFVHQMVKSAGKIDELFTNPLLHNWFSQTTKTNEARRCLHYLFKIKCERIDTFFFTVKNIYRIYLRYDEINKAVSGTFNMQRLNKNSNSIKSDERELSNSEKGMLVKSMDEYAFYKEMFS